MPDRIVDGLVLADPKVATTFNDSHVVHLIGYLNIGNGWSAEFFIRAIGVIRG